MHQHNESRHISSIDNHGCFHRKKIANAGADFPGAKKHAGAIGLRFGNVAKKTHRGTNYCTASRVIAEMSFISPGV
jgi:hypothetical protein